MTMGLVGFSQRLYLIRDVVQMCKVYNISQYKLSYRNSTFIISYSVTFSNPGPTSITINSSTKSHSSGPTPPPGYMVNNLTPVFLHPRPAQQVAAR
jgi:hypothetical protein